MRISRSRVEWIGHIKFVRQVDQYATRSRKARETVDVIVSDILAPHAGVS
jgi:hypothetical protein